MCQALRMCGMAMSVGAGVSEGIFTRLLSDAACASWRMPMCSGLSPPNKPSSAPEGRPKVEGGSAPSTPPKVQADGSQDPEIPPWHSGATASRRSTPSPSSSFFALRGLRSSARAQARREPSAAARALRRPRVQAASALRAAHLQRRCVQVRRAHTAAARAERIPCVAPAPQQYTRVRRSSC